MAAELLEVVNKIKEVETKLMKCKEELKSKEASLILYSDWKNLKETKGISNQKMRDAHVHELIAEHRQQTMHLEIERDYLKRLFQVLLIEGSQNTNAKVESLERDINNLKIEIGAY